MQIWEKYIIYIRLFRRLFLRNASNIDACAHPNLQFMVMAEMSTFGIMCGRNVRGRNVLHSFSSCGLGSRKISLSLLWWWAKIWSIKVSVSTIINNKWALCLRINSSSMPIICSSHAKGNICTKLKYFWMFRLLYCDLSFLSSYLKYTCRIVYGWGWAQPSYPPIQYSTWKTAGRSVEPQVRQQIF